MGSDLRTTNSVTFAFAAAVALTAVMFLAYGVGHDGVDAALRATARLAFLYFLPAYAAGALVALFGSPFQPLAKRGRDLGLAFAAVEVVHLSVVALLCAIGFAPGRPVFIFFGTAAGFVFLLALFSFARPRRLLHPTVWNALRFVGMNFIAYAFFVDFKGGSFDGGFLNRLYYLPFLAALVLAVMARVAARALQAWNRWAAPRLQQKA